MEGRRAGTPGAERARRYLVNAYSESGLAPLNGTHTQTFSFSSDGAESTGTNVLGVVRGRDYPDRFLVVTAHYDHLGARGSEIFNGADDNASGTAALLALARYFLANPTRHSLLFVAFDAEEVGLRGAEAFIAAPPVPLTSVLMNVNLDMVSRNEAGELYAVGTHHYPSLRPLVEETARRSEVTLLTGHDTPGLPPGDDWTLASDHGPFHSARIPFIYFGVEDHAGYHTPSDTFEAITPEFYGDAVETILDFILLADEAGESISRLPR
jgi:Zn-dependent M28 family amino/carboxypeptidase